MFECEICKKQFKGINALSAHISEHGLSKPEYFDRYLGWGGYCCVCGMKTKFLNIVKGYVQTCSPSCATKMSWQNDDARRDAVSTRMTENNICVPGARKGRKNKLPYPMTEKVLERIKNNHDLLRSRNFWHHMNVDIWSRRTDDEIEAMNKKRDETRIRNNELRQGSTEIDRTLTEKTYNSLSQVFGL